MHGHAAQQRRCAAAAAAAAATAAAAAAADALPLVVMWPPHHPPTSAEKMEEMPSLSRAPRMRFSWPGPVVDRKEASCSRRKGAGQYEWRRGRGRRAGCLWPARPAHIMCLWPSEPVPRRVERAGRQACLVRGRTSVAVTSPTVSMEVMQKMMSRGSTRGP